VLGTERSLHPGPLAGRPLAPPGWSINRPCPTFPPITFSTGRVRGRVRRSLLTPSSVAPCPCRPARPLSNGVGTAKQPDGLAVVGAIQILSGEQDTRIDQPNGQGAGPVALTNSAPYPRRPAVGHAGNDRPSSRSVGDAGPLFRWVSGGLGVLDGTGKNAPSSSWAARLLCDVNLGTRDLIGRIACREMREQGRGAGTRLSRLDRRPSRQGRLRPVAERGQCC